MISQLKTANPQQVRAAHRELKDYIKHMKENPAKTCTCCGSIVPDEDAKKNLPQPNKVGDHVVTLTAGNMESLLAKVKLDKLLMKLPKYNLIIRLSIVLKQDYLTKSKTK